MAEAWESLDIYRDSLDAFFSPFHFFLDGDAYCLFATPLFFQEGLKPFVKIDVLLDFFFFRDL